MSKRPWQDFTGCRSQSFVTDLVEAPQEVHPDDLVNMASYRKEERREACKGSDPIIIRVAYAQNELIYDEDGRLRAQNDADSYAALPRDDKLNKFGLAYRKDAPLLMHKTLADITIIAAIHLYQTHGWRTVLYDSLRTMEGAYKLYCFAPDKDIADGLLALPGESAHNKGLAVDSMLEDKDGMEVDMGAHFDHLDMTINNRAYAGNKISEQAKKNRIIREAAFLRGALSQGLLVAPLRSEFWDDRLPENRADLWRVLDSAARCLDLELLSAHDLGLRKSNRAAFKEKWERWNYKDFLEQWQYIFSGRESDLEQMFGVVMPPLDEKASFYHGNFHPIYDSSLVESGKNLTESAGAASPSQPAAASRP
ncbi:MAG: M15 family metallopeptidase [Alphaproteobacteria bacterium]